MSKKKKGKKRIVDKQFPDNANKGRNQVAQSGADTGNNGQNNGPSVSDTTIVLTPGWDDPEITLVLPPDERLGQIVNVERAHPSELNDSEINHPEPDNYKADQNLVGSTLSENKGIPARIEIPENREIPEQKQDDGENTVQKQDSGEVLAKEQGEVTRDASDTDDLSELRSLTGVLDTSEVSAAKTIVNGPSTDQSPAGVTDRTIAISEKPLGEVSDKTIAVAADKTLTAGDTITKDTLVKTQVNMPEIDWTKAENEDDGTYQGKNVRPTTYGLDSEDIAEELQEISQEEKDRKEFKEIEKKIKKRKKENARRARRARRLFWTVVVLLILAIAFFILSLTDFFTTSYIEVRGNNFFTAEEIINIGHATPGRSLIYHTDSKQIVEYLEANPYIKSATVTRKLPSTLLQFN